MSFCIPAPRGDFDAALSACVAAKPQGVSFKYTPDWLAAECDDSSDCGPGRICCVGSPSGGAETARCLEPTAAGCERVEICHAGTCRSAGSRCVTGAECDARGATTCAVAGVCASDEPLSCGASKCAVGEICCMRDSGPTCARKPDCQMNGAPAGRAWECIRPSDCPAGMSCCVIGDGEMGSRCAFECNLSMETWACEPGGKCPDLYQQKTSCGEVHTGPPGAHRCQ